MGKLVIIGIGYRPLDAAGDAALASASCVLGSKRLVEVFSSYPEYTRFAEKVKKIDTVDETMSFIHDSFAKGVEQIVLLGSGDPLFFGIGARAIREFGPDTVEIIPDLTSLQRAFSRAMIPWDDALFISFHAGPNPAKRRRLKYDLGDLPSLLDSYETIGILTDKENNPTAIARFLVSSRADHPSLLLFVGEKMGYEDERMTRGTPAEIAAMTFVHPNVVIVKKRMDQSDGAETANREPAAPGVPDPLPRFGLREDEISHSAGLITKDEVRAVSLHRLRLPDIGVLWDVGAGSGSLSVEAARLCPGLTIFAIEKTEEQLRHLVQNKDNFGASGITVVPGVAPSALSALPDPDRVFIGGSGGNLRPIIETISGRRTRGPVVINATTLDTLGEAAKTLEEAGFTVHISEVSIARSKQIGDKQHMAALNPIFVISGEKG